MVMETLQIELHGATHAFPVLELRDRRKRGNPKKKWALVRATEILLFDVHDRSRGRFAAHLAKCSMDDGLLVAERAAVTSGVLTEGELGAGKKRTPASSLLPKQRNVCPPLLHSARRDAAAARCREPLALPQGGALPAADPRLGAHRVRPALPLRSRALPVSRASLIPLTGLGATTARRPS